MIKILIAEDSDVVAMLLKAIFEDQPDMQVVGRARNGHEAVRMVHDLQPDLVTMDIRMPVMDGFEATRMIMSTNPVPIVVISSSVGDEELRITFRAIEEGALAVMEKPHGVSSPDFSMMRRELVETVRSMAEVRVIRRRISVKATPGRMFDRVEPVEGGYQVVSIGCSTGGPQALQQILSVMPAGFPTPILIAQHIAKGFVQGLVAWLQGNTLLSVKLAEDGELLRKATVYLAPDDYHLEVAGSSNGLISRLRHTAPVNGFRPSATPLLQSVAYNAPGRGIGMVLTGMGGDGAEGLLAMRKAGCHTLVQDDESAVIYGMPGTALAMDAVDEVVKLDKIPAHLIGLVRRDMHKNSTV